MPENVLNGDHVEVKGANCEPQDNDEENTENDVHFEPIISLPLIEVSNNEEDEIEMLKLRAKLYRYDTSSNPAEWKERGTGEVKLLRHKVKNTVRVVMRRDKTLKICANHFVTPWMELKPNCGSDRAWVWSVLADYADEQLKPELLAIRFANAENALVWKEAFEKAKKIVGSECEIYAGKNNPEQKRVESDSESSSDVSYSESTDNEEPTKSLVKQTDESDVTSQQKETEKEMTKSIEDKCAVTKSEEKLIEEIKKLEMKNEDEKK
ncbi:ran-specific GTPase-activating protein isoform X1 [Harpegnathos saltator]|uniref:Ran-specific GTPase-activating protein n=1 Tax=Harpegnathos saltator TaxID=610380 RepID=E2BCB2_HARSA|nr:ran-specific GTPase-activating protein isoform X1 [Harpegnathos saltator]EFN86648.1 Ran-specific GTPase-activating protein [Harpegnathos saltator]